MKFFALNDHCLKFSIGINHVNFIQDGSLIYNTSLKYNKYELIIDKLIKK